MNLAQQYADNLKRIQAISVERESLTKAYNAESNKIHWAWADKIHALEKRRDDEKSALEKVHNAQLAENSQQSSQLMDTVKQVERILMFLSIKPREVAVENMDKAVGMIYSDKWLKMGCVINQNRKPKNKYSLRLTGVCSFVGRDDRETLFKIHSCSARWGLTEISDYLKDFPTEKEAIAYFNRHKDTIGKEVINEYQAIKKEYEEVIATYTLDDFRPLFIYECKACGFFVTEYNSDYYSRSIEAGTCGKCDIDIKDANKIAKMPKKELPLYVSYKWATDAAKEFYNKRLEELAQ